MIKKAKLTCICKRLTMWIVFGFYLKQGNLTILGGVRSKLSYSLNEFARGQTMLRLRFAWQIINFRKMQICKKRNYKALFLKFMMIN